MTEARSNAEYVDRTHAFPNRGLMDNDAVRASTRLPRAGAKEESFSLRSPFKLSGSQTTPFTADDCFCLIPFHFITGKLQYHIQYEVRSPKSTFNPFFFVLLFF